MMEWIVSEIEQIDFEDWVNAEELSVARRLACARREAGVKRGDLAFMLGVDESEIASYEDGVVAVPASVLVIVASLLDVKVDYFFGGQGEPMISAVSGVYRDS